MYAYIYLHIHTHEHTNSIMHFFYRPSSRFQWMASLEHQPAAERKSSSRYQWEFQSLYINFQETCFKSVPYLVVLFKDNLLFPLLEHLRDDLGTWDRVTLAHSHCGACPCHHKWDGLVVQAQKRELGSPVFQFQLWHRTSPWVWARVFSWALSTCTGVEESVCALQHTASEEQPPSLGREACSWQGYPALEKSRTAMLKLKHSK